ncbi:hypothetical protein SteCoe_11740 [Stentor coeruleus]|uniref:Uncharacterized protein n=1 Tax=Stentor coeruleus TaxID=5963 RepID=A0A1R2CCE1_9CILI|nr:hypothetical protein SteCoe_11740 [Stentor coeruleus]
MDSLKICLCKIPHTKLNLLLKISVLSECLKEILAMIFICKEMINSIFEIVFCHFLILFFIFTPLCCIAIVIIMNANEKLSDKDILERYYYMKKYTLVVWLIESVIVCIWLSVSNMPKSITIPINFADAFGLFIDVIMLRIANICYTNLDLALNSNEPNIGNCIGVTQADISHEDNIRSTVVAVKVVEKIGHINKINTQYLEETKPSKTYDFTVVKFSSVRSNSGDKHICPEA